ncbi:AI-2E family transporter [Flavisolibacter ginsenosidimutans]|uniref:AI-2E family transporter n=1 Tax=Flavisolibacter ginsenosidimutans TaxID=661481 RepID=A0A5B8UPW3_9BACT|nr:AI-2E family transporter [Flavisolibacter ginsenosidimutans]QEC57985.1 AI-2E family transporter [Flavisolibacter ginsenosidimutans]
MEKPVSSDLYRSLRKLLALAAGIFVLLWFLYTIVSIVLLLIFSIIVALLINAPVTWLEKRKIKRTWGTIIVFAIIILVIALLSWLIIPKIIEQLKRLIANLPQYLNSLTAKVSAWFSGFQGGPATLSATDDTVKQWLPSIPNTLLRIGNYSISVLGSLLILIVFISIVVYMVMNPRPLLEIYLSLFQIENRGKAARALSKSSLMIIGWMRANLVGGGVAASCVVGFLNIMHIPGAWVWGAMTFFSELVPKIGFFIMVVPPLLVALSISPATALWLAVFFIALSIIVDDSLMPKLRSSSMNLHPVSIMFILLAMSAAFGFIGVLIATPLTAFIKAFYEEFYLSQFEKDEKMEENVDAILFRKKK